MVKNSVPTYNATIYCGLKPGYERLKIDQFYYSRIKQLKQICQEYCDEVGLCVTFRVTEFIYTNGNEPGVEVGLINYARFPSEPSKIRKHATTLAEKLMKAMDQHRVSVVTSIETILLENEEIVSNISSSTN
jgi:hypothetical protein